MLFVVRYEHLKKGYVLLCQYDNEDSGVRGLQNQLLLLMRNEDKTKLDNYVLLASKFTDAFKTAAADGIYIIRDETRPYRNIVWSKTTEKKEQPGRLYGKYEWAESKWDLLYDYDLVNWTTEVKLDVQLTMMKESAAQAPIPQPAIPVTTAVTTVITPVNNDTPMPDTVITKLLSMDTPAPVAIEPAPTKIQPPNVVYVDPSVPAQKQIVKVVPRPTPVPESAASVRARLDLNKRPKYAQMRQQLKQPVAKQ